MSTKILDRIIFYLILANTPSKTFYTSFKKKNIYIKSQVVLFFFIIFFFNRIINNSYIESYDCVKQTLNRFVDKTQMRIRDFSA